MHACVPYRVTFVVQDLIWNFKTREELRECLESEVRAFGDANALRGKSMISWNHTEFELRCATLILCAHARRCLAKFAACTRLAVPFSLV
jgi:hypothetical protein